MMILKTAKTIKAEPTQYDQHNKVWTNQFQFKIEMMVMDIKNGSQSGYTHLKS